MLNKNARVSFGRMAVHLSVTQVQAIIDAVRNQILDWALELEKAGVHGDGYSFNEKEQALARDSSVTYNINSIGTFAGNMGSGNVSGDISISQTSMSQILKAAQQIRQALPDLERAGIDAGSLSKTIDALEIEASKPTPDRGRLRALLSDAKEVLVGAAGNLTAEGAMAMIAAAIKLLGG